MSIPSSVIDDVLTAIAQGDLHFPVLPEMANRLRTLINDPNVTAREIVSVISGDIVISAHLIKIANSAAYADKPPIENIAQAISRLGYMQVHNLVLELTLGQLLHTRSPLINDYLTAFWERNRVSATFCFVLARLKGQLNPDRAMLAALLHNIGVLPLCLHVEKSGVTLTAQGLNELAERFQVQVGASLLRAWNFPEPIVAIIAGAAGEDGEASRYADLVTMADLLQQADPTTDWVASAVAQRLGLDEMTCRSFTQLYERQIAHARGLLGMDTQASAPTEATPPPAPVRETTPRARVQPPVQKQQAGGLLAALLRFFGIGR